MRQFNAPIDLKNIYIHNPSQSYGIHDLWAMGDVPRIYGLQSANYLIRG